jgi:hypothetical protein
MYLTQPSEDLHPAFRLCLSLGHETAVEQKQTEHQMDKLRHEHCSSASEEDE